LAANKLFKKSLALVLSGGEPTLNRDLFPIINYAKDYFPMIHLTTNGTMLGVYMDKIPDSGLTHINISLDAPDIEEYKKMRIGEGGELVFEKVTENIKKLVELKKSKKMPLQIVISSVSGKLNYKKMGEMIEFGRSLGADSVNLQNICGFNCEALSNQTIMAEDAEIMRYIKELRKKYSDYNIAWPRVCSTDKSIRGCRQPFDSITLDADGNVGPCSVMVPKPDSKFGNILRDREVWNNEEYIKLRESLLDNSGPLGSRFCRDCTFLHGDTY
jgi:radical SAM protein with 4Fe4S-binding SPASM domain